VDGASRLNGGDSHLPLSFFSSLIFSVATCWRPGADTFLVITESCGNYSAQRSSISFLGEGAKLASYPTYVQAQLIRTPSLSCICQRDLMAETSQLLRKKESRVRNSRAILISCLVALQLALLVRCAFAVPMARGSLTDVNIPEYAIPGTRLAFSATAVNDGDSTGWFRICFVHVSPPLSAFYPSLDQTRESEAVHCSMTIPLDPGQTITFQSAKFRMQSVPNTTFWALLTVQQHEPISNSDDGSDLINLTVDDLRVVVITNFETLS